MSVFDVIHLLHGARGGESQTNRMCMQVSVSMSVLSVFVLSAFVCLFTALIVQIIRWHRASSLYYMLDKYQAAILHSKCSSSNCKMINDKTQGWWLSSSSCCGTSYAPWSEGGCLSSALLNAKTAFRWQNQKDRDSRVDCLLETGCFNNKEEGSGRREKSAVRNEGLRDALLRGPKTFVLCNRKPSYSVLLSVLGVARSFV